MSKTAVNHFNYWSSMMMMIMSMSNLPCLPVMQVTFCFKRRVVRRRGCVSVVVKLLITGGMFSWMEQGTGKVEGTDQAIY